jgi:ATP-dependent helicase/nuclease subunit A
MTMSEADRAQRAASNPAVSVFVSASAGSGKTKLLTDRLLRLMLAGTRPEKILCLTYTKAAAAEMAIRLNRRLGEWVVMPAQKLDAALRALDAPTDDKTRALARKLFADVLDLPGGMRIGTIHAFCQSLLRRFPLEANLSPHFELADEAKAASALREARELVMADPHQDNAISLLAAETNEQDFAALTAAFSTDKNDVQALFNDFGTAGIVAMQRAALAAGDSSHDEILAAAVTWPHEQELRGALRRLFEAGTKWGKDFAEPNLSWLGRDPAQRLLHWSDWVTGFFSDEKPRSIDRLIGKALAAEHEQLQRIIAAEQERIGKVEEARKAAKLSEINQAVTRLMAPILRADQGQKTATATLSYADLITRTGQLLIDPGAAWILYKLDGGIDHLLLDEVQDTAPAQWNIAYAIADEFFAGLGARGEARSIFAVGDSKQSIFSFQGADLQSFQAYAEKFRNRVRGAGQKWLDARLDTSFRSTAPVLALVDAVFAAGPAQIGVTPPGTPITHRVSRAGQAGVVRLWPLTRAAETPAAPDWAVPDEYQAAESAKAILARDIAAFIRQRLDDPAYLPSRARRATAGDFLILVRHRDELVTGITRAAKAQNIPIAGADRMVLTEQPAVSDLLALCDALLLPADDLAFGQFLASPLGGFSDDELMRLAIGRRRKLFDALSTQRDTFPAAYAFFQTLRAQVDFITPHALLAQILGPMGGRARLLERLGPDAAEPLDEVLAEALAFTRGEPASLQMFLHHLRTSGAQIKREADAAGDVVRIMTVHGAKGLQAPIVILPDTTGVPKQNETLFWLEPPQQPGIAVPIFCPRKGLRAKAVADALAAKNAAQGAEQNRLLYVALTRAEDELLICGAQPKKALPEACWYKSIEAGFARLPATQADGALTHAAPQTAPPDRVERRTGAAAATLPAWAGAAPAWLATPPSAETTRPEPLAPSRGTEDEAKRAMVASPLGGNTGGARAAAMAKGQAVHALLQHLPDLPPAARAAAAAKFLDGVAELDAAARAAIVAAVLEILANSDLAPLFGLGSRAEVPLAGVVGDVEIGGLVDRLAVLPDRVVIADYKTDRVVPAGAEAIPPKYLAQLAAYRAILGQIYPALPIECLLIFTQGPVVMPVPPALLVRHAPA